MNEQFNWYKNHKIGTSLIGIKTDILSRTVLELSQVIVQILDIRLNDLSYGIKILAELSSVLLQSTRLTDTQIDGRTD